MKIEQTIEKIMFNSRWLLAVFYIGLVLGNVLLLIKFLQELIHIAPNVLTLSEGEVVVGILSLVDMALVGSLLLMIVFSGYEIFVSKIDVAVHEDRPDWMGKVDFSGLKLKVISAIVAISAIELLKTFMEISGSPTDGEIKNLTWKVIIHATFVLSGVMFALMDKIAGDTKRH